MTCQTPIVSMKGPSVLACSMPVAQAGMPSGFCTVTASGLWVKASVGAADVAAGVAVAGVGAVCVGRREATGSTSEADFPSASVVVSATLALVRSSGKNVRRDAPTRCHRLQRRTLRIAHRSPPYYCKKANE